MRAFLPVPGTDIAMFYDITPKTPERSRPLLIPKSSARSDSTRYSGPGDTIFDTPSDNGSQSTPYTPPETSCHYYYLHTGSPSASKSRQLKIEESNYFHPLPRAATALKGVLIKCELYLLHVA